MDTKQRLHLGQPAAGVLKVLSSSGRKMPIRVLEGSGKTVTISSAERLAPGTPVTLEVEGGLVLAEVAASSAAAGDEYQSQLIIDQVIPSLHELGRLVEAVMNAGAREEKRSLRPTPR